MAKTYLDPKAETLYQTWRRMIDRCTSKKNENYAYYGGRGIKVCARWRMFTLFYEDMEATWQPGLTLDRTDVNRNYEPDNCRWITQAEQNRNTRRITVSDEQILALREEFKAGGISQAALGRKYGIPERSVSNFLHGTTRIYLVASPAKVEAATGRIAGGGAPVSGPAIPGPAPVDATPTSPGPVPD